MSRAVFVQPLAGSRRVLEGVANSNNPHTRGGEFYCYQRKQIQRFNLVPNWCRID